MEFTKENLTLFLSVFATLTSLILSWLKIKENRNKSVRHFEVTASINKPFKKLEVIISNKGYRPITIKNYELHYGNDFIKKIIYKCVYNEHIKLQESDMKRIFITGDKIIESRKKNNITQEYSCELWFKLHLSTGETSLAKVVINPDLVSDVNDVNDKKAIPYILADLFLGYEQLPIKFDKFSRKSKYQTGR